MIAVDTNILIYSLDRHDLVKWAKACNLLRQLHAPPSSTLLLWQVMGEFMRYLRSLQDKGQISRTVFERHVRVYRALFPMTIPTPNVLDRALDLSGRYSLSHWDSMLLGACLEAGVDTLYTEDMGARAQFDSVRLVNPFV